MPSSGRAGVVHAPITSSSNARDSQLAIDYLESGQRKVKDLVTATLPVDRMHDAFDLAFV